MTIMNDDLRDHPLLTPPPYRGPVGDPAVENEEELRRRQAVGRREHIGPPLVHTPAGSIWEALELPQTASWDEIRTAHRRLLIRWHPDRHVRGSDEEQRYAAARLAEVNSAFATLKDRHRR